MPFVKRRKIEWYAGWDSNPHVVRHWNLNPARLPISPPAQIVHAFRRKYTEIVLNQ